MSVKSDRPPVCPNPMRYCVVCGMYVSPQEEYEVYTLDPLSFEVPGDSLMLVYCHAGQNATCQDKLHDRGKIRGPEVP